MSEKPGPIISEWHKFDHLPDAELGYGFWDTNDQPVVRKSFQTEHGVEYYALKATSSEAEAKRTMEIYSIMKKAGLPITDFMKVIRKADPMAPGGMRYAFAMQDITENGRYFLEEVCGRPDGSSLSRLLIARSSKRDQIERDAIRALAVIHNNGIFNFHTASDFYLRLEEKDQNVDCVDFQIIDYSNFAYRDLPANIQSATAETIEERCRRNLLYLLRGMYLDREDYEKLENEYNALRNLGELSYEA